MVFVLNWFVVGVDAMVVVVSMLLALVLWFLLLINNISFVVGLVVQLALVLPVHRRSPSSVSNLSPPCPILSFTNSQTHVLLTFTTR